MQKEEVTAIFDKQTSSYDQQWSKMAPINGALHLLTSAVLSELPPEANILCVEARGSRGGNSLATESTVGSKLCGSVSSVVQLTG